MAEFLYRIQPTRSDMLVTGLTDDEDRTVGDHFDYLKQLMADGILILAGRTQTNDATTFGIIIFNADTEADAQAIMENDPAVQRGVFQAAVFPYRIALLSEANVRD